MRDELKYSSDFALTASNPQNATETKVLEKDAYKQEGGEFNLPEFSSKEGDSTHPIFGITQNVYSNTQSTKGKAAQSKFTERRDKKK